MDYQKMLLIKFNNTYDNWVPEKDQYVIADFPRYRLQVIGDGETPIKDLEIEIIEYEDKKVKTRYPRI